MTSFQSFAEEGQEHGGWLVLTGVRLIVCRGYEKSLRIVEEVGVGLKTVIT